MKWYYIDGPRRVGPIDETEWAEMVRTGKIRPETLVWHEGMDSHWLPLSEIPPEAPEAASEEEAPEEAEALELEPETPEAFVERVTPRDYTFSVSECVAWAWSAFVARIGVLVGATFVAGAIFAVSAVVPVLDYLVPLLLHGVLMGGLMLISLRALRKEPTEIADLFAGFRKPVFMQLMLQTLVSSTIWQLCFIPALIAMKMLGVDPEAAINAARNGAFEAITTDPQTAMVLLLVLMTCSIPAVYFVYCWMFSVPLIIDKGLPFWPAMQLSRRKVLRHPWKVGILSTVAGLVAASGLLLLGIGFILTAPLYTLIMLALYEEIFRTEPPNPGEPQA
ncbi:MAG: GYF domain-containing protein [Chthoniobacteraceae bacterium]